MNFFAPLYILTFLLVTFYVKNSLIHSSNNLAVKSIKENVKFPSFFKSCVAFSEVTIPSISDNIGRMTLYLETAEVTTLTIC